MILGFVTTVPVTHATPAGLYAHTCNRFWECDDFEIEEPSVDIARQLVDNEPANKAKVVMGGGRSSFLPLNPDDSTSRFVWIIAWLISEFLFYPKGGIILRILGIVEEMMV